MDHRPYEFTVLIRPRGKESIKITFYSANQWPKAGGRDGLWRLKIGHPKKNKPGEFSERWWPGPREYRFLTDSKAWSLVAEMTNKGDIVPGPLPNIPVATPIRVPNGNVIGGELQTDVTRTATKPVRLDDGRAYVVVHMFGKGAVHVPVDEITVLRR